MFLSNTFHYVHEHCVDELMYMTVMLTLLYTTDDAEKCVCVCVREREQDGQRENKMDRERGAQRK